MGGKARGKKGKTSKAEKEQKRAARLSLIDKEGRMPRQDGIRFYCLLDFVALIVIEDVEKARQPINGPPAPPLGWPQKDGMQCMSVGARNIVIHHILKNIDDIVREVDSGRHDAFFKTSVGRSIEEADKKDIRSWKNHVQDEFIVVDFIPHKGAVFVQVGRVPEKEVDDHLPRLLNESDVHEPRVFLVKGLASPLADMCGKQSKELLATYPSLSSYDLPIAFIHTTLLNYLGGITYAVNVDAENQSHYRTPQLLLESARIAVEAYKSTVLNNESVSTSAKLYKSIEPAFARLANDERNAGMRGLVRESMLAQDRGDIDDRRGDPKVLTVSVLVMMWLPFQHGPTDPATLQALEEITSGDRPLRVLREGFKYQACKSMDIRDDEPCPLCRRMMGDVARPFVECCKPGHLKRAKKGIKHQDGYSQAYLYNPVDQDEGNYLIRNPHLRFEIFNRLRIGPLSCSDVKLIVPRKYIEEIKWRLDNAPIFLAVLEYKWLYLGWAPLAMHGGGIISYGDISLDPETGAFVGGSMSEGRLTSMIKEMRFVCEGIPVEGTELIGSHLNRNKPDKRALARSADLLAEKFRTQANVTIDRENHRGWQCAYCGKDEETMGKRLLKCACKTAYYCCKDHQKQHWKDHKAKCKRIRKVT